MDWFANKAMLAATPAMEGFNSAWFIAFAVAFGLVGADMLMSEAHRKRFGRLCLILAGISALIGFYALGSELYKKWALPGAGTLSVILLFNFVMWIGMASMIAKYRNRAPYHGENTGFHIESAMLGAPGIKPESVTPKVRSWLDRGNLSVPVSWQLLLDGRDPKPHAYKYLTVTFSVTEIEGREIHLPTREPKTTKSPESPAPPARKPHLSFVTFDSFGMYQFLPNTIGAALKVVNDEHRFSSTAHNIRASLRFRHALGDAFIVTPGFWYDGKDRLEDHASLKMDESKWRMLFILNNSEDPDYRVVNSTPPDDVNAPRLEYGEWSIDVTLVGDNAECEISGTLTIQRAGKLTWAQT